MTYKRLTYDEAVEAARDYFRVHSVATLGNDVLNEMRKGFRVGGGSVGEGWADVVGSGIDERQFYEITFYKPLTGIALRDSDDQRHHQCRCPGTSQCSSLSSW